MPSNILVDRSSVFSSNAKYIVIIDAGSSGSRVNVYEYDDPSKSGKSPPFTDTSNSSSVSSLPSIRTEPEWKAKVNGGISEFVGKLHHIWHGHLGPLIELAESVVPPDRRDSTPVYFLATAGMRLLPDLYQRQVLGQVCNLLSERTDFYIPECNSHVQVIDGATEGLYGWLALNYLLKTVKDYSGSSDGPPEDRPSFGFMDMGGASAQIAFAPSPAETLKHADDLYHVTLRTLDGINRKWNVFVSTWLGFGANEARRRLTESLISASPGAQTIVDDCTPRGHSFVAETSNGTVTLQGSGNFNLCFTHLHPLLNKNLPCKDDPCLFDGVHVPAFDFNRDKFVGVSEYWHTANDIFNMDGRYDFTEFNKNAKEFCALPWDRILENSDMGLYKNVPEKYLETACFKATWIMTILHEGFGLPLNLRDRQEVLLLEDEVYDPAMKRNIHDFLSPFQSAMSVDGNELSWALGRAVLYASSQVPPAVVNGDEVGYRPANSGSSKFVPGGEFIPCHNNSALFTIHELLIGGLCMSILFILAHCGIFNRTRRRYLVMAITKHLPLVNFSRIRKWTRPYKDEESDELLLEEGRRHDDVSLKDLYSAIRSSYDFALPQYSKSSINLATTTSMIDMNSNVPSRVSSRLSMRSELYNRPIERPQFSLDGDSH